MSPLGTVLVALGVRSHPSTQLVGKLFTSACFIYNPKAIEGISLIN